MPPRIHNLLNLAQRAEIELTAEKHQLFGELSAYYIQSRYPEEIRELGAKIPRNMAADILLKTEESIKWLLSMIK